MRFSVSVFLFQHWFKHEPSQVLGRECVDLMDWCQNPEKNICIIKYLPSFFY